jgi:hypothetical protein
MTAKELSINFNICNSHAYKGDIYHIKTVMNVTDTLLLQDYHMSVINGRLANAMVTSQEVSRQLKAIGVEFFFWGKAELRELEHILTPGEKMSHCVKGHYEGGYAVLCATDRRILLIDKKPFSLTLEDVRYDLVSEVDFSHRLLDATIRIFTGAKTVHFTSMNGKALRKLTAYVQDRVMATRQAPLQVTAAASASPQGSDVSGVSQYQYQAANPYTKIPLMMRRRVSRFYSS